MSASAPTLYTVPPHVSFVDSLAGGLLAGRAVPTDSSDPLALSRLTILLPTRRACRALQLAFRRAAPGRALLLPRIRPLGDIDEDEPSLGDEDDEALPDAVSPLERRLQLTRLVQKFSKMVRSAALTEAIGVDQASRLARAFASLLDEIQIARLDPDALTELAPAEYAAHWQEVLTFLAIIMDRWPAHLAEKDMMDPWARRNALLERLAESWAATPPAHPVIAAGSTGSVPATRDLLATIARLPQGAVVLPGLDTEADDETWEAIGPTHPQYALKGLLDRIGVMRGDVLPWPSDEGAGSAATRARSRLIADAMRPAETITAWRGLQPPAPDALRDLHRIDCASPQGGGGRHRHRHAPRAGDPRPHRRAGDGGSCARPPGRGGASALADRGERFRRRAAGRNGTRRLSAAHRTHDCRGRRAGSAAGCAEASARGRRRGARGVPPFRAGDGDGDPARRPGLRRGSLACVQH